MTEAANPTGRPVLREMRWWDIEPVLELEKDLFPEDAWSRGMFWSDLAHARGPEATRRYLVAVATIKGMPDYIKAVAERDRNVAF